MADIDMPLAWRMMQDGYLMQINQLRDENAKLRQLALELFLTLDGIAIDKDGWACYAAQLHELGVMD